VQLVEGGHAAHAALRAQPGGEGFQVLQVGRFVDAALFTRGDRVLQILHAHQVLADKLGVLAELDLRAEELHVIVAEVVQRDAGGERDRDA
jgi:hypothetical protein